MVDETLTIWMVPYRYGWCLAAFNHFRRWYCGAALLGTVVGSNCIRALSGNKNARHPDNWPAHGSIASMWNDNPGSGEHEVRDIAWLSQFEVGE